jgi:hypothetical protein
MCNLAYARVFISKVGVFKRIRIIQMRVKRANREGQL